jgi:hypothetical protein
MPPRQSSLHMPWRGESIALAWVQVTSDSLKGDYYISIHAGLAWAQAPCTREL